MTRILTVDDEPQILRALGNATVELANRKASVDCDGADVRLTPTEWHLLEGLLSRREVEVDPGRPRYLLTEPGIGYRFEPGLRSDASGDHVAEGTGEPG